MVKSLALAGVGVALLPRRIAAYNQPGQLRRLHGQLPAFPGRNLVNPQVGICETLRMGAD